MEEIAANACFGGKQLRFRHHSSTLGCEMTFSAYLPALAGAQRLPVLYWLSGLTCTDENFVIKAGAQQYAAHHGIVVVAPDTSPRGESIPDDPDGAYDFGLGAGFYVNATEPPWRAHYQMYDYVTEELPALVAAELPIDTERSAISGHSMGGHGALTVALKNPSRYRSASAFAPICSPMACPWGEKALSNYLGPDTATWAEYDTVALIQHAEQQVPLLIDQGTHDEFLHTQLKPELLEAAAAQSSWPLRLRMQDGYDHSYFFIATFIGEHIAFHADHLTR